MDSKTLRKQYITIFPKLEKVLKYVNEHLVDLPQSDFLVETNLKPYASIKNKVEKDGAEDPSELSDLVRGRIFYSDKFNADDVVGIIKSFFGKYIKNIDDNTNRASEHGLKYRGIVHVDMNFDGIKFEMQLMPKEFKPYKEFLHQIYDEFRNPDTRKEMSDHRKKFLRQLHNKLYQKLDDQAQKNRSSN